MESSYNSVNGKYHDYCKPKLAELLHYLKLDQSYIKASGSTLLTDDNRAVADFVGGFGTVLVGHNNSILKETVLSALNKDLPINAQASQRNKSADLAISLNNLIPGNKDYLACFTNSGTESVEAALKHAYKVQFDKITREYERISRILNDFYYEMRESTNVLELPCDKKLIDFRDDVDEYNLAQFEKFQKNPTVIAFKGSFHGKSTSSLKITFNKSYREGFQGLSSINSLFVDISNYERIPQLVRENQVEFLYPVVVGNKVQLLPIRKTMVIGLIFEPILGEGGIIPVPKETLEYLALNHEKLEIPYIIDEIQTGCGRTGSFYCYEQTALKEIEPEYIVLSKALGGGIAKIGATLIRKDIYDQDFGILHTSTFGEDDLSSSVASRFIELVVDNDNEILKQVVSKGKKIKKRLGALKEEYPEIIKDVRGVGLLIGIEFTDLKDRSPFFRLSGKQGVLSLLIASYLLEYHNIRLLAPLTTMLKGNPGKNRKSVLRIQPPAVISDDEINRLVAGLKEVLEIINNNNEYCLIGHLFGEQVSLSDRLSPRKFENAWPIVECAHHIDSRVGFIVHPTSVKNLIDYFFPSFHEFNVNQAKLVKWWDGIGRFLEPVHVKADYITSNDYVIECNLVLVPYLPDYISSEKPAYLSKEMRDKVQDAVIVAKELGDENIPLNIVGLGAYTSIITSNGLSINDYEMNITTGNAFTVALAIEGLRSVANSAGSAWEKMSVAVVGANGNIGQALSRMLAPQIGRLVLVGSKKDDSLTRLRLTKDKCIKEITDIVKENKDKILELSEIGELFEDVMGVMNKYDEDFNSIKDKVSEEHIYATTDFDVLKDVDAVVLATNSSDAGLIKPEHLRRDSIICCTSVPTNLHRSFKNNTKNITAFDGGMAKLPDESEVRFVGFPSGGMTYGCLAETLILGFEGHNHSFSKGVLEPYKIKRIIEWADIHGFELGDMKLDGNSINEKMAHEAGMDKYDSVTELV